MDKANVCISMALCLANVNKFIHLFVNEPILLASYF